MKATIKINKEILGLIAEIASKTVGYDIPPIVPMSHEEDIAYRKKMKEERKEWERQYPEQAAARRKFELKSQSRKPYVLSPSEREIVKEVLKMDDATLDECAIDILNDGDISVRTSQSTWMALAGREWWINIPDKTAFCAYFS